jgi:uncharacterized protein (DUF342 family)
LVKSNPELRVKRAWTFSANRSRRPAPRRTLPQARRDGIAIDEAGHLISTRTGARTISSDDKIDVVDHHIHPGSVDLSSGNLKTGGSLEVARDVTTGMSVWAASDLKIAGMIDGGRLYAGGSLEIVGGAIGREVGAVHAEGISVSAMRSAFAFSAEAD